MTTQEVRRRPGGRSAQVRASVLAAALELLSEVGPSTFTIAEVAKRSGVHETSIYRRWGSRERLVLDAMSELSKELLPVPDTGSLRGDLLVLGQALVEYAESPLGKALIRTMAVNDDAEEEAKVRAVFWSARYAECRPIVDRAVARQEVPASIDGRLLLEAFAAPIHVRLLLTREDLSAGFLETLADIVVRGVAATGRG